MCPILLFLLSLLPGCLPTPPTPPHTPQVSLSGSHCLTSSPQYSCLLPLLSAGNRNLRFHLCWSLTTFQHLSEHPGIFQALACSHTCACQQPSWRASSSGQHSGSIQSSPSSWLCAWAAHSPESMQGLDPPKGSALVQLSGSSPLSPAPLTQHAQCLKKTPLCTFKKRCSWASLVAQWERICLPMQETQVQSLIREDPTCLAAAKPVHHT